jgi:hypothetical protein
MGFRISFLGMNKHLKLYKKTKRIRILLRKLFNLFTKNGSRTKNIGVLLPTKSQIPIEILKIRISDCF